MTNEVRWALWGAHGCPQCVIDGEEEVSESALRALDRIGGGQHLCGVTGRFMSFEQGVAALGVAELCEGFFPFDAENENGWVAPVRAERAIREGIRRAKARDDERAEAA